MYTTSSLGQCCVHVSKHVSDAMRALEAGRAEIALITDDEGRLLGTFAEADVRRALLGGGTYDSPLSLFMRRDFVSVGESCGAADVVDLMQTRAIAHVLVVDGHGKPVGLHLRREILGNEKLPNLAVIMVGGKGSRLGALTKSVPKPMLPVAGRPILERIVLHLVAQGVWRIFLAVHHLADVIVEHFGDGTRFGCRIEYLREARPLGTGGALGLLREPIAAPILTLNGDVLAEFDVRRLLAFHTDGGFMATVTVREYTHTIPLGVVDLAGVRVTACREKPTISWQTNAGIHVLRPELLSRIPSNTVFHLPSLVEDCLSRGEEVGAYPLDGDWVHIRRPSDLRRVRSEGGKRETAR